MESDTIDAPTCPRIAMSAIERLGALITEGEGDLEDRVNALPQERFVLALSAMRDAFWGY